MPVYFDTAKQRWRFSFNRIVRGARRRSTKLLPKGWSQRQAEAFDRREGSRLYAEATGVEQPRLKLAPAVQLYLQHRTPLLRNGKKAAQDLHHLSHLIEHAYLDQVDQVCAEHEKAHPELSPATLRNRFAYLRAAVRYARKRWKYGRGLPDSTADIAMPAVSNARQVYARLPELEKLWKAFDDEGAKALFTLTFYMGLRWRAELLTRAKEHIHKNGRDVWLEIGTTKNGAPVMKPVHPKARWALAHIPFKFGDSFYYRRWQAATAAIGREDLHVHDLRHSLASEVLSRPGGTLDDVRAALHHKSLQAADRYAHLYPERMKAILHATGRKMHTRKSRTKKATRKKVA